MRIRKQSQQLSGVVSSVQHQTAQAEHLARIPGQDRLTDPRTNPAVRPHADRLRDVQHRRALDTEHDRLLRRHRVENHRAAHAEKALLALQEAREASSAAKSVLILHAGRARFMGVSLVASLTLSAGSAMGVEHLAVAHGAEPGSGYIAEVGLTGLTTMVILYRSHLTQNGGRLKHWQSTALSLLMLVPLLASMLANLFGAGPVGVFCSIGAAAFSLLSYVIADASAAALRARAAEVTGDDETNLRKIATGNDLFSTRTGEVQDDEVRVPVHAEVREPAALEVHEPTEVHVTAPEPANPNRFEPEPVNHAEVREPAEPEHVNPGVPNRDVDRNLEGQDAGAPVTRTKAANLGDRAKKKAAEVRLVRELIEEIGYDAVTLNVVRERFGFTKTTAYHRLVEARNLVNQAVAS